MILILKKIIITLKETRRHPRLKRYQWLDKGHKEASILSPQT